MQKTSDRFMSYVQQKERRKEHVTLFMYNMANGSTLQCVEMVTRPVQQVQGGTEHCMDRSCRVNDMSACGSGPMFRVIRVSGVDYCFVTRKALCAAFSAVVPPARCCH